VEKPYHKSIREAVDEHIHTEDDVEFTPEEVKHTINSFSQKKAPGLDGITGGIYQCVFHVSQHYYYNVQPMLKLRKISKKMEDCQAHPCLKSPTSIIAQTRTNTNQLVY
jgi:hypothetical protein